MCDDNIEIGVTEITNNILVSAQPTDQIIDINVLEEVENVELTITPSLVEVNIDVTQELITEEVTIDANTCVNIIDVSVTDATDNVTLNINPSLVEVNINRGENNLSIEEYDTFVSLPTIGDTDTYYITLDENKFWRWDNINEVYVEISSANSVWGSITGTLSNQTDLWNALNSKQNVLNGIGFVKASGTTITYDNSVYTTQSRTLTINGASYDLSANRSWTIPTIVSVVSPLSLSAGEISISKANATTDGFVSLEDWNYFSAKQQALSGTGFIKATGSVISYDNTVYTPQERTLTINGDSYDLSADRSWSISVGSGMRNVSSFIATLGQTTFTIIGGYTAGLVDVFVNGVRLNASDYTATNGTTVVLAVGLVANDIVDIINYTASLTSGLTGSGTTNYISKWSGSSSLTNSLLFDDGTKVGLNTNTPDSLFHVYSNNTGTPFSDIAHIGSGAGRSLFVATNAYGFSLNDSANRAGWGITTDWDSGFMRFHYGSSEKVRITSSGNVGIGNTNPNAKLDVTGAILASSTITASSLIRSGGTSAQILMADGSVITAGTNITITGGVISASGGGGITGSGTTNYITKWTSTSVLANSLIYDNGTNVGIGMTTGLTYKLNVNGEIFAWNLWTQQSAWTIGTTTSSASITGFGSTGFGGITNTLVLNTNGTERLRITSAGDVAIGITSTVGRFNIYTPNVQWAANIDHGNSTQFYINFRYGTFQTGSIMGNGTTTSYNITSDYRLKEDLKPIKGLEQVSKINVYDFKFKNSTNRMDGVIAHELQEILPYAVTGIKDGKDMQSVDYSKIVPILVQAIKELNAKIEAK